MYGLDEIQVIEVLLLLLHSGLIIGTFIGMLTRGLNSLFYR